MNSLSRMAARARRDPFFMGWAFAKYQNHNSLTDESLAEWLGCGLDQLTRLSICRKPNDQSPRFAKDVRTIADFGACCADRLLLLLREVEAVDSLSAAHSNGKDGFLMAARDRKKSRQEDHSSSPEEEKDLSDNDDRE